MGKRLLYFGMCVRECVEMEQHQFSVNQRLVSKRAHCPSAEADNNFSGKHPIVIGDAAFYGRDKNAYYLFNVTSCFV